ncbi:MAG: exopolysaccharide biosynthesis protein [Alphaproteobacteria bacterium]|nr:exopolysaccharide biosynthesis protein [Alphaproteobacteria bacterium]
MQTPSTQITPILEDEPPQLAEHIAPQGESRHSHQGEEKSRRTSVLLREFLATQTGQRVKFGDLRDALDDRGFGVLIFIFAFPNMIAANIPLASSVLGFPLVLLAAQLTYGRHKPWFPRWLTSQTFPREKFTAFMNRALPYLERCEKMFRPRLTFMLSWTPERLIGALILVLAVILALPIPFGNWLPALSMSIIGLAMVEKDGVAVLAGLGVAVAALIVVAAVITGLIRALLLLFSLA